MTTIHTRFAIFALIDAKKMKRKIGGLLTVLHPKFKKMSASSWVCDAGLVLDGLRYVYEVVGVRCAVFVVRAILPEIAAAMPSGGCSLARSHCTCMYPPGKTLRHA